MTSSTDASRMKWLRRDLQFDAGSIFGPPQYTNWVDEEISWKTTCYLGDWSFIPTMKYSGPDVMKLFEDLSVNTMNNFAVNQSKHIIECNENGKIIEEGILTRISDQDFMAYSLFYPDYVRRNGGDYDVETEMVDEFSYHLQGPNSLFVLEKLLGQEFRSIRYMRNEPMMIAGVETRILRQGMSGEIGFELQGPLGEGKQLYDAIMAAGQEFGIHQMGGRVSLINHLQAGYPTGMVDYLLAIFDEDIKGFHDEVRSGPQEEFDKYYFAVKGSFDPDHVRDYYRSPVEFNWGGRINFDHEFTGDEALRRELENPRRKLCTLRWNADDVIGVFSEFFAENGELPNFIEMPSEPRGYMYFDRILKDGQEIGNTSNRGYSAYFRAMLSNAVIDIEHAEPGTEVTVVWGDPGTPQREIRAVVHPSPYKEHRGRVDLATVLAS